MNTVPADKSADRSGTGLDHFELWPENNFWSFQFLRMMGKIPAGGGDFSEIILALQGVRPGDAEAWYGVFSSIARRLDADAESSLRTGNSSSARDKLYRATNYHHAAGFFLPDTDPRHSASIEARRASFQRAAPLADPPHAAVEIPYEDGTTLPGYFFPGACADEGTRQAAAVIFGGTDAVAEEMYFFLGRALAQRGIHTLAMDGPGQGEALRRGIAGRHDWELPASAAYDFLTTYDFVDPGRIAVVGQSLGGYLAARAAAYEPRFAAAVIWGAIYDLPRVLGVELNGSSAGEYFTDLWRKILCLRPDADLMTALNPYNLHGVAQRIACPTLLLHGESDRITPFSEAEETFANLTMTDKTFLRYPAWTSGCTHCQADAPLRAAADISDWLCDRLSTGA
ncbi:prolyl oligopeptidase family protein [Tamaricihabitans halophyticus]|uniref:Prolyl oligopeptidase family protein n=1 Tax=Tamaricihabitans halophyticus TaxID=1262583 RepID=A0A4R2Q1T4_9PSEU|nr:alpha/beta fold hydrolase [Tamaricihabitans halophyticus]TCP42603.1 prolyl oligopeptidase family protein [Tamaricihabitans halophyticus]